MALKPGYADQLARSQKELGLEMVRFHGIFDDDVGVWMGKGKYNFTNVKRIYDTVTGAGMRPFVELSYMPQALAENQHTVFAYAGHTAPPTDWDEWGAMITAFVRFLIATYGHDEVKTWPFEVWNEPNCGFYTPTAAQPAMRVTDCCVGCAMMGGTTGYMHMYKVTARAVKAVSPDIKVGGPASAQLGLMSEFLYRAKSQGLPVDFVSTHLYPTDPVVLQEPAGFASALDGYVKQVRAFDPNLEVYLSEYNSGLYADLNHDSSYAAAFTVAAATELIERDTALDLWSYWTFSDIFEEQGWISSEFHNGFGLMTINGIPKPAYRAMELLNLPSVANGTVVATAGPCGGALRADAWPEQLFVLARPFSAAGRKGGALFFSNFGVRDSPMQTIEVTLNLTRATMYSVDDLHTNPSGLWNTLGAPNPVNVSQFTALMSASQTHVTQITGPTVTLQLLPYSVVVLEVDEPSLTAAKATLV
jgi:xylan 1,4-beta-xylosidase